MRVWLVDLLAFTGLRSGVIFVYGYCDVFGVFVVFRLICSV